MIISEPKDEEPEKEREAKEKIAVEALNNGISSRRSSIVSRRTPVLVRSRKSSRMENENAYTAQKDGEDEIAGDTNQQEFVKNEFLTVDPSEGDHLKTVPVDSLDEARKELEQQCFAGLKIARDRTGLSLFLHAAFG